MTHKELAKLMGMNLRRLRLGAKITQEQLAERLQVSSRVLQRWESGEKGIGSEVLLKLCKILDVRSYAFHMDGKLPYLTNTRERKIVSKYREAERLGVDDLIMEHCETVIDWAKRKQQQPPASRDVFASHYEERQEAEKASSLSKDKTASCRSQTDDADRRSQ